MKIITHPTVTLVTKQVFLGHPKYDIPSDGSDAVKIGAFAAKGCYDSYGKSGRANEENQKSILDHRHGSVLEHIVYGVYIEGITRALSLESNRHRHLAVSQRSTRYTAEEDATIVLEPYYAKLYGKYKAELESGVLPPNAPSDLVLIFEHIQQQKNTFKQYVSEVNRLMELNPMGLKGFDLRKWARGKARNILSHSLETRIMYTGNVRAWRWFIESRTDKHAEPEIRRLANEVFNTLYIEAPLYFEDFHCVEVYDGIPVLATEKRKV